MSIESTMSSKLLILCCLLLLMPSIFSSIRVFSNESALHIKWPKHWSFSIILPMNIQGWFPSGLTGLISLLSKGPSRVFSSTTAQKHQFFDAQSSFAWTPWTWTNVRVRMRRNNVLMDQITLKGLCFAASSSSSSFFFFWPRACSFNHWTSRKVKSLSRVRLFATPWTVPYQAPLSMGFSRR